MPRLTRVQFRSVGHPNARFEDVTLDFRDPAARPLDSVIWLRNGGGKSSLLNLLFAVIRTDRRDFLGGRADSRQRSVEDYILPDDTGLVATEWLLDTAADQLLEEEGGERLVTGVFYERRREREQQLRRLFFMVRSVPGKPETQLETLPFTEEGDEGGRRRTLHGFKQALHGLQERYGVGVVSYTDTQRQWQEALDDVGLDPDLFRYQLRMNLREGGADELFRFANDNEFVDFLLELTVDPTHSEEVGENIELFREQLRRRQQEFLPELEFCDGLHERLVPLAQHAREEQEAAARLARCAKQIDEAAAGLQARIAASDARSASLHATVRRYALREQEIGTRRSACERLQLAWEHHAATRAENLAAATQQEHARAAETLDKETRTLQALQHHLAVRRLEEEVQSLAVAPEDDDARERRRRLHELARRYAAALKGAAARGHARVKENRQQQDELHQRLQKESERAAVLRERLTRLELRERLQSERRRAFDAAKEELIAGGLLRSDEAPADALVRQRERVADSEARIDAFRNDADDIEAALAEERERAEVARSRARALEDERGRLDGRLASAETAWQELCALGELKRLLQSEDLSPKELSTDALVRLSRLATVYRQRALTARARLATIDRDADALRVGGLLAPEPAVATLLDALGDLGRPRTGWRDLEERCPANEERRTLAEKHPELARGVVVDEAAFDDVCEALATFTGELPVVVATPAAWDEEGDFGHRRFVTPAAEAARYDKRAGRDALAAMEDRAHELSATIDDEERAAAAVGALIRQIERCASLYPLEEIAAMGERLTAIEEEHAAATETQSAAASRLSQLQERLAMLRDAQRQPEEALHAGQRAVIALEHLLERQRSEFNESSPDEESDADPAALHDELKAADDFVRSARQELEVLDEEIRLEQEKNQRLELELEALALDPNEDIDESRGDLDALRSEWKLARVASDSGWEGEGREQMLQHARQQLARERSRRDRLLSDTLDSSDLESRVEELQDHDAIEAELERLRQRAVLVAARRGEAAALLERAREESAAARKAWEAVGSPAVPQPDADVVAARRAAARLESEAAGYAEDIHEAKREKARAEESLRELELDQRTYREQLRRIGDARHAAGLDDQISEDVVAATLPESMVDLEGWSARLIEDLVEARKQLQSLTSRHNELTREIRKWSVDKRFDAISGELVQRFRRMDEQQFVEDAEAFMQQLSVRSQQLRAAIDEMNRHRRTLTQLTLQLAIEGIRQLELASAVSSLPDSLEAFGGERFVDIRLQVPQDPAFRSETIGQLIDELVVRERIPSGIELVQMAVRRLAAGLRVRVLNPNPAAHQRRIPVAETAKFSGGEQLTSAILLFCTLANVRARNRGVARQPTTVLILDNPIGRASRRRFIEMQLAFARAMNVQLIYTTAVQDAEALSVMPNLIRLRNEKVDPRRSLRIVEREEVVAGQIEAARITRVDPG